MSQPVEPPQKFTEDPDSDNPWQGFRRPGTRRRRWRRIDIANMRAPAEQASLPEPAHAAPDNDESNS